MADHLGAPEAVGGQLRLRRQGRVYHINNWKVGGLTSSSVACVWAFLGRMRESSLFLMQCCLPRDAPHASIGVWVKIKVPYELVCDWVNEVERTLSAQNWVESTSPYPYKPPFHQQVWDVSARLFELQALGPFMLGYLVAWRSKEREEGGWVN